LGCRDLRPNLSVLQGCQPDQNVPFTLLSTRILSPALQRFLEAVAAILDLKDGRLELVFRHGRLEAWATESGMHRAAELRAFDGAGDRLLDYRVAVTPE